MPYLKGGFVVCKTQMYRPYDRLVASTPTESENTFRAHKENTTLQYTPSFNEIRFEVRRCLFILMHLMHQVEPA